VETLYTFAVYESPKKYTTFSIRGMDNYKIMRNKLKKHDYWFTVCHTTPVKEVMRITNNDK
jgi:hypothetical protein